MTICCGVLLVARWVAMIAISFKKSVQQTLSVFITDVKVAAVLFILYD